MRNLNYLLLTNDHPTNQKNHQNMQPRVRSESNGCMTYSQRTHILEIEPFVVDDCQCHSEITTTLGRFYS